MFFTYRHTLNCKSSKPHICKEHTVNQVCSHWNRGSIYPCLSDCIQTNTHPLYGSSILGNISFWSNQRFRQYLPSHLGIGPLHMTFPLSSWQEMVSLPWVLMNPSSQTTEMELPSWKLSPKRRALMGMPGSGHSLWPNAAEKGCKETQKCVSDKYKYRHNMILSVWMWKHLLIPLWSAYSAFLLRFSIPLLIFSSLMLQNICAGLDLCTVPPDKTHAGISVLAYGLDHQIKMI